MEGLDRSILQACMTRRFYSLCIPYMKDNTLCSDAREVLIEFRKYFKEFKTVERFTKGDFIAWLSTKDLPNKDTIELIVKTLDDIEYKDEQVKELLKNTSIIQCATELSNQIGIFNAGDLDDPMEHFQMTIESTMDKVKLVDDGFVDKSSWTEVFEHEDKDGGLPWFSKGLGELCHSLLKGRFVIVGASTDCGKTTFLLNNALHWVKFLEEDEKIAWFNNEESTQALWLRVAQRLTCLSEFELTTTFCMKDDKGEMVLNERGRPILDEEALVKVLNDILGFDIKSKFVFLNAHNMSTFDVEMELKRSNYRAVIFDMLDHIKSASTGNGQQADIEFKYNWARRLASIYECSIVASSQTSVEGNSKRRPALEDLKDSKVGKQTTCDLLIMLGYDRDAGDNMPRAGASDFVTRFASTPKNKMRNPRVTLDEMKYVSPEVMHTMLALDPSRAIVIDVDEESVRTVLERRDTLIHGDNI